jgi:hypothetical protein
VVYPHGRPPMPPLPWIRRDPSTEKPFVAKDMPLVRGPGKARLENVYPPGRKTKSIAIGPGGASFYNAGIDTAEESARRNLETCGAFAGVACMIVAVDDVFARIFGRVDAALRHLPLKARQNDFRSIVPEAPPDQNLTGSVEQGDTHIGAIGFFICHCDVIPGRE